MVVCRMKIDGRVTGVGVEDTGPLSAQVKRHRDTPVGTFRLKPRVASLRSCATVPIEQRQPVVRASLLLGRGKSRHPSLSRHRPLGLAFYFLLVTTAAIAALQSSPRLARASLMQVTFWMRPLVPHCCFSMSALHVFLAAATSANLVLHASERSATRSLRQVAMRLPPGLMSPQTFLISALQAPIPDFRSRPPDCAIAPDTKRNDKAAQIDKIFSI